MQSLMEKIASANLKISTMSKLQGLFISEIQI